MLAKKITYKECKYLPPPFDRYAFNYKKWEIYAEREHPPGKCVVIFSSIQSLLTKNDSYLEKALDLVELPEPKGRACVIGLAGMVFSYIGQKARGIQMLREAMQMHPSSDIVLNLATELDEEYLNEGIELCKSVLKDEPDNIRALRIVAVKYLNLGEIEKAEKNILHALNVDSKNCLLRQVMGDILYEKENYLSALKEYKKAKTFLQFKPYITYRLAGSYYYLGKLKKSKKLALKIRDDVFESDPHFRENSVEIKKVLSEIISE